MLASPGLGLGNAFRPYITGGLGGGGQASFSEDVVCLRRIRDIVVVDSDENAVDLAPQEARTDAVCLLSFVDSVALVPPGMGFVESGGPLVDRVVRYRFEDTVERPSQ